MLDTLVKLSHDTDFVMVQHKGQGLPDYPGINKIMVPTRVPYLEFLWVQLQLPTLLKRHNIAVCHSLKHVGPLQTSVPTVLHVREVGHFFPEGQEAFKLSLPNRLYWTHVLPLAMKRATHVIGVSGHCKDVIVEKFGIPERRVSVVYQGIDPKFRVVQDKEKIADCRRRYGLPLEYILAVGNLYPHKNYDTVVKMLAKLRQHSTSPVKLVIVGDESYAGPELHKLIADCDLDRDIVFTGYVEHDDLIFIYNAASLLLFPPIVASFPNPCLEAMACGIPVVASDRGAVAEVTGGAALLLNDPKSVDQMLGAVSRVLDSQGLRAELRERGFLRVGEFSWEASARRLLGLYEELATEEPFQD
jgi:glycosyltransferase involved in cell wall biosynthesis